MGPLGGSVGDTLAQALALLEEGKDREAEALLLTPRKAPWRRNAWERTSRSGRPFWRGYLPKTPASPSPGPGWRGSAGSTGCEAGGKQSGSQQAKVGPEGRAKRRSPRTLPLLPPGCHERGYAGGQVWNPFHVTSA
jgi:hypothetical protein